MGDNAVKEEGAAAAAHTQLSAARDLVAAGSSSNAVPTTPAALEACADGLCKAVAAAFGGDGKVPRASGWKDAKAAPGKGDGWIKSDVELCAPAPTQPFPPQAAADTRARGRAGKPTVRAGHGALCAHRQQRQDSPHRPARALRRPTARRSARPPRNPLPTKLLLNSRCCPAAAGAAEGGGEDTAAVPPEARAKSMVESSLLRSYVTQQLGGGAQKKRARPAEASHDSDDDDAPRHAPPPPPPPPHTHTP